MNKKEPKMPPPWSRIVDPAEDDLQRAGMRKWYESMPREQLVDRALWLGMQSNYYHKEMMDLLEVERTKYAVQYAHGAMSSSNLKSIEEISARIEGEMEAPDVASTLRLAVTAGSRSTRSAAAKKGQITGLKSSKKAEAKAAINEAWRDWKNRPHLYATQTEFANEMLKKHQDESGDAIVAFDSIIKKWIPTWTKKRQPS